MVWDDSARVASSSAIPQLQGLEIEAVEWLPSGADSGLVRVRGRWTALAAAQPGLPELLLRAGGGGDASPWAGAGRPERTPPCHSTHSASGAAATSATGTR